MSKKEILLVGFLIFFGFFISFFETDSNRPAGSREGGKFNLIHKDSPNIYIQEERTLQDTRHVIIDNAAGDVVFDVSPSTDCIIIPVIRVFHPEKTEADRILKKIRISTEPSEGVSRFTVDAEGKFPLQYVRTVLTVHLPRGSQCDVQNAHGDIFASQMDVSFSIQNRHGSTTLKDIPNPAKIRAVHNKSVFIKNLPSIKLSSRYSKIKLYNISDEAEITQSSHGAIGVRQCGDFNFIGEHTRLILQKVKGDINISNSHSPVTLEEIRGDIRIDAKNCPISLSQIQSEYLMVKNRFRNLSVRNLECDDLDILITHGNLLLNFSRISGMINIKNTHSNITLDYPGTVDPAYNIHSYQGRIFNHTGLDLEIIKKEHQHTIQKYSGTPEIIINNTYGDITLQHSN